MGMELNGMITGVGCISLEDKTRHKFHIWRTVVRKQQDVLHNTLISLLQKAMK